MHTEENKTDQTEPIENAASTENVEPSEKLENDSETNLKEEKSLDELSKVNAELGEMKDKYLRLYAEFDNYRKRSIREREDLIKLAAQDTIKNILPTLDDLERAIKHTKPNSENNDSIIEGIQLIHDKLFKTLEQQGLKAMDSDHQAFDPDLHEALTKVPAPTEEMKGKVIETIEKGYYLKDKIIRYAKVVVGL
jgi:molecular chaperone GrpE